MTTGQKDLAEFEVFHAALHCEGGPVFERFRNRVRAMHGFISVPPLAWTLTRRALEPFTFAGSPACVDTRFASEFMRPLIISYRMHDTCNCEHHQSICGAPTSDRRTQSRLEMSSRLPDDAHSSSRKRLQSPQCRDWTCFAVYSNEASTSGHMRRNAFVTKPQHSRQ